MTNTKMKIYLLCGILAAILIAIVVDWIPISFHIKAIALIGSYVIFTIYVLCCLHNYKKKAAARQAAYQDAMFEVFADEQEAQAEQDEEIS